MFFVQNPGRTISSTHLSRIFPLIGHEPGGAGPGFRTESGLNHFMHPIFLAFCYVRTYVRTYVYRFGHEWAIWGGQRPEAPFLC